MRYRALDANGDMTFGLGEANFLVNSPATVAQAVLTRLRLMTKEWFLDQSEGTPYDLIVGKSTQVARDTLIRNRILGTQGVVSITNYSSNLNTATRAFSVDATIDTIYGATRISITL